jgi:5-methylcytosine-specific restriction protein A
MRPPTHSHYGYRSPAQRRADHEAHRARDPNYRERRRIYSSRHWAQLKATVRQLQPWCEECLKEGKQTPWVDLHHRVDISMGGLPYELANVVGLCRSHHSRYTAERGDWGRER